LDRAGWRLVSGSCETPTRLHRREHFERVAGVDAYRFIRTATGRQVAVMNDAEAAGYAEMHFGAGRRRTGLVVRVTLGTGIGTALFINAHLVPNTELGHLQLRGAGAEHRAAARVRKAKDLSSKKWSHRVDEYLHLLHGYFWRDRFIVGRGVSRKWRKFGPQLTLPTPVVPAKLRHDAGIIGAGLAHEHERLRTRQKTFPA
jgi:polyphosphate glucokinase